MRFNISTIGLCSAFSFLVLTGCFASRTNTIPENRWALLLEGERCHQQLKETMKNMTGARNISISPDAFRYRSDMLLSNWIPEERIHQNSQTFAESADKRFLLHMNSQACHLSLVDRQMNVIATQELKGCRCVHE